jgi:hypothetical protein
MKKTLAKGLGSFVSTSLNGIEMKWRWEVRSEHSVLIMSTLKLNQKPRIRGNLTDPIFFSKTQLSMVGFGVNAVLYLTYIRFCHHNLSLRGMLVARGHFSLTLANMLSVFSLEKVDCQIIQTFYSGLNWKHINKRFEGDCSVMQKANQTLGKQLQSDHHLVVLARKLVIFWNCSNPFSEDKINFCLFPLGDILC